MMGISDWFKRLRAQDDAQDVELAEEKARHEGVPAGDLPADQGSVDQDLRRAIDEVQRSGHIPMP